MNHTSLFIDKYKKAPDSVAFTPYRICPLGAHVDHQLGKITGFALDKGIHIAYGVNNDGIIEITSMQFDGTISWTLSCISDIAVGDWADHLRGATIALKRRYSLRRGVYAVIEGELPIGGLSSSAAVIITFLTILSKINGITLTENELIELALEAENKYVGVSCGKLDQCCEVYCRKDKLLYMDLKTDKYELVSAPDDMPPYKIAIFFSGIRRSLAGTKYNARVDEAKAAACSLLAYSGANLSDYPEARLVDVTRDVYYKYRTQLSDVLRKRADHFFGECERVEQGVLAWRQGDIEEFGRLVFESGKSSIELWETGSEELKELYQIMTETHGVYGGRFSGAGFKGCCMAIIDPAYEDEIICTVRTKYIEKFPHLASDFSAHICTTADGVRVDK